MGRFIIIKIEIQQLSIASINILDDNGEIRELGILPQHSLVVDVIS